MEGTQSALKLYLLGSPRLERNGVNVRIGRRKAMALLAYLAVTGQPQNRDTLLPFLWPQDDTATARVNLRRDLSYLRKTVGATTIPGDNQQIRFDSAAGPWVDVLAFRTLLAEPPTYSDSKKRDLKPNLDNLEQAATLANGDFMAGFGLADAPAFDDWQYFQASALRHELTTALRALIAAHTSAGRFDAALPHAHRWLALDPLHEPAQRELLQLLAWSGQTAAALEQFTVSQQLLAAELGVKPEAATQELVAAIRERQLKAPETEQKADRPVPLSPTPTASAASPIPVAHNLPAQPTPFIGREIELTDLAALLADPTKRLITIVAPGGMGKTRLALAAADGQLASDLFPQGIYFVPLAPLSDPAHIIPALAEAMHFPLDSGDGQTRPPRQQILDFLRAKQILLILDNFEHLLDGAELVSDLLREAPGLQILATSRERLHLLEEQLFVLGGLEFPDWETPADAAEYTAVKLFLQAAGRVNHSYQLAETDLTYLSRICRLVGGMPLAVELAAGWVDALSLAEIAAEIQRNLDFLETELRNIPERQRSMRAVFDAAWGRLGEAERELLPKLSIFRGGFSRPAAQSIAGASLRSLFHLVSKALLQYDKTRDRYQMHELLRQYAAERLAQVPEQETAVRDGHAVYYLASLAEREPKLKGRGQQQALQEIEADLENVRLAWQQGIQNEDWQRLEVALEPLGSFFEWTGRFEDGASTIEALRLAAASPDDVSAKRLLAQSSGWAAAFQHVVRGTSVAMGIVQDGIQIGETLERTPANQRVLAFLFHIRGILHLKSDFKEAENDLSRSVEMAHLLDDGWLQAHSLSELGVASMFLGKLASAQQFIDKSIEISRTLRDRRGLANALHVASAFARHVGDYERALQLSTECLELNETLQDPQQYALALIDVARCQLSGYGRNDVASQLLKKSLGILTTLAHPRYQYQALFVFQFTQGNIGQIDQAIDTLREAIDLAGDDPRDKGVATFGIGFYLLFKGNPDQAYEWIQKARKIMLASNHVDYLEVTYLQEIFLKAEWESGQTQKHRVYKNLSDGIGRTAYFVAYTATRAAVALLLSNDKDSPAFTNQVQLALEINASWEQQFQQIDFVTQKKVVDKIAVLAASLPPEVVRQASARGAARNWLETASHLLRELTKLGWGNASAKQPTVVSRGSKSRHNLPPQPTHFLGRADELATLTGYLHQPDCRLITIVGPGGMGKTRLALALAEGQLTSARYPNGIFFVSLAPLADPDQIPAAMAEALDLPLEADGPQRRTPQQQLLDYLSDKRLLLLMDNFEHLLDGAALVNEILAAAPDVQILATSRERLGLRAEQLYAIGGLQFPDWETPEDTAEYTAVRLFLQSARQLQADFSLTTSDLTYLSRICRLVEGMPLAVELAAGWVDTLSLPDIAAEIQRGLDFLTTDIRDIPARQRSIHAVFDATWARLSPDEQTVFAQTSVFRGGFTRAAVQAVTGASLRTLANLVNKSLLRFDHSQSRYQVHELVRQYAAEKLGADEAADETVRNRYANYYCRLLATWGEALKGTDQVETLSVMETELQNCRHAFSCAVEITRYDLAEQAMFAMGTFHEWQRRYEEGVAMFGSLVAHQSEGSSTEDAPLIAHGKVWQSVFQKKSGNTSTAIENVTAVIENAHHPAAICHGLIRRGQYQSTQNNILAKDDFTNALKLCVPEGDQWDEALARRGLGESEWNLGNFESAQTELERALRLLRTFGDSFIRVQVTEILSGVFRYRGDLQLALAYAEECLETSQHTSNPWNIALAKSNLAITQQFIEPNMRAVQLQAEALTIFQDLNALTELCRGHFRQSLLTKTLGDLPTSNEHIEIGLTVARKINHRHFEAVLLGAKAYNLDLDATAEIIQIMSQSNRLYRSAGGLATLLPSLARQIYHHIDSIGLMQCQQQIMNILQECLRIKTYVGLPLAAVFPVLPLLIGDLTTMETDSKALQITLQLHNLLVAVPYLRNWIEYLPWHRPIKQWAASIDPNLITPIKSESAYQLQLHIGEYMLSSLPKLGWPNPKPFDVDEAFALLGIEPAGPPT